MRHIGIVLKQEFCDFKARQLRRDGVEAVCWYVDD